MKRAGEPALFVLNRHLGGLVVKSIIIRHIYRNDAHWGAFSDRLMDISEEATL